MFVPIIVWISMCIAPKEHVDSAFQVFPAMQVTCSSEWGDRHAPDIFKYCAL